MWCSCGGYLAQELLPRSNVQQLCAPLLLQRNHLLQFSAQLPLHAHTIEVSHDLQHTTDRSEEPIQALTFICSTHALRFGILQKRENAMWSVLSRKAAACSTHCNRLPHERKSILRGQGSVSSSAPCAATHALQPLSRTYTWSCPCTFSAHHTLHAIPSYSLTGTHTSCTHCGALTGGGSTCTRTYCLMFPRRTPLQPGPIRCPSQLLPQRMCRGSSPAVLARWSPAAGRLLSSPRTLHPACYFCC